MNYHFSIRDSTRGKGYSQTTVWKNAPLSELNDFHLPPSIL